MLSPILSVAFIVVVAILLTKRYNAQAVLIISGLMMLLVAFSLGNDVPEPKSSTGFTGFDIMTLLGDALRSKTYQVGLMIMTIGGFVEYMKHIGASRSLVELASKPIRLLDKSPYLAACCVIPIGQFLFMCAPSAAGLGLLLMASIYPVLVKLKISKVSIVAVISATTVFDLGPSSANTSQAASLIGVDNVTYFLGYQLPLAIPMTIALMVIYFFVNRYYDKKENLELGVKEELNVVEEKEAEAPKIYALFPVFPLVLLMVFSEFFEIFNPAIVLDTTTAMFITLFCAFLAEMIRLKKVREVLDGFKIFWSGMGRVFASVVTLIIAADVFSKGLISLGFIDSLVGVSTNLGLGSNGISIVMTVMIFGSSMLMGSGNASFFSFGPLVPSIVSKVGGDPARMILSMQFSSSMGRATSPISGVLIATSDLAGISAFDLAKRNLIPLSLGLVLMFLFDYFL